MANHATRKLFSADDIADVDIPGKSTELLRGRLVVREPPSTEHGRIQANLAYFITDFVRQRRLGVVVGQDTGFKIASRPDTVRGPDVAFIAQARAGTIPLRGYASLAPDLVAEIVSPGDRPGGLLAKVGEWLDAGTSLVWVIDPLRTEARVYRADGGLSVIPADGALLGADVLPGFRCALADVLS